VRLMPATRPGRSIGPTVAGILFGMILPGICQCVPGRTGHAGWCGGREAQHAHP
jgi:hypothetical protein